jgi:hypothetical protein
MSDDRFERELRGFLAERAPAAVNPALRARLHAVSVEFPVGAGTVSGWLGRAWRTLVGVATVAVAAVILVVLLTRPDSAVVRDPGQIGGPSAVPAVPQVPFVTAPTALFSAAAVADADRRLAAVFETSGIEGRLIVQSEASATALTTPAGWPDRFDADGDDALDVTAAFGMAPDGTISCCLTITGDLIDRAREEGYWGPASWPDRLKADMESDDPAIRDEALDRFVSGIEALQPGMPFTREAIARELIVRQFAILIGLGILAAVVLVTRSRWSMGRARPATPEDSLDLAFDTAATGASGPDADVQPVSSVSRTETTPVTWTSPLSSGVPRDRTLLAVAAAGLAGLFALGLWDLVRPPSAGVPLDIDAPTVGLASPVLPLVPLALLATAGLALLVIARNGGKARRVAIVGLMAMVGLGGWWAFDGSRPAADRDQRSWVAGVGAGPVERGGAGLFDLQTYPLEPGEPFTLGMTVTNPGALPITILGIDGVQPTQPNPHVASIVGLASVDQPTVDGTIQVLSAKPEDASVAWPITLSSGDELAIVLLGRAGPCADPDGTGRNLPIMWLQLTYRVLGIERSEPIALPPTVSVPSKVTCTVEIPGGTVTHGEPSP